MSAPAVQELITKIKAHIARGDRATEKAGQHYISAGQYLAALKESHAGSWAEWEALLKDKVGISTGRASELMQIADGRKTVEGVRAGKAESMKRLRASSPRGEENADEKPATKSVPPRVQRELEAQQAHIDDLEAAREHDGLAEELQAAKIKITGLESEIEELKAENASLREQLKSAQATSAAKPDAIAKKRGRPKGSKNRPKPPVASAILASNDPGPFPAFLDRTGGAR